MIVKLLDVNHLLGIAAVIESRYVSNENGQDYYPYSHVVYAKIGRDSRMVPGRHYSARPANEFSGNYYLHFNLDVEPTGV